MEKVRFVSSLDVDVSENWSKMLKKCVRAIFNVGHSVPGGNNDFTFRHGTSEMPVTHLKGGSLSAEASAMSVSNRNAEDSCHRSERSEE